MSVYIADFSLKPELIAGGEEPKALMNLDCWLLILLKMSLIIMNEKISYVQYITVMFSLETPPRFQKLAHVDI